MALKQYTRLPGYDKQEFLTRLQKNRFLHESSLVFSKMFQNHLTLTYSHFHNQIHLMLSDPKSFEREIKEVHEKMLARGHYPTNNLLETLIYCATRWPDGEKLAKAWFSELESRKEWNKTGETFNHMLSFYSGISRPAARLKDAVDAKTGKAAASHSTETLREAIALYGQANKDPDETSFRHILAIQGRLCDITGINQTMHAVRDFWPLLMKKAIHRVSYRTSRQGDKDQVSSNVEAKLDRIFIIARMEALAACVEHKPGMFDAIYTQAFLPLASSADTELPPPVIYAMIRVAQSAGKCKSALPQLWEYAVSKCGNGSISIPGKEMCARFLVAYGRAGMRSHVRDLHSMAGEAYGEGNWDRGAILKAYSLCDYDLAYARFELIRSLSPITRGDLFSMMDACRLDDGIDRQDELEKLKLVLNQIE